MINPRLTLAIIGISLILPVFGLAQTAQAPFAQPNSAPELFEEGPKTKLVHTYDGSMQELALTKVIASPHSGV